MIIPRHKSPISGLRLGGGGGGVRLNMRNVLLYLACFSFLVLLWNMRNGGASWPPSSAVEKYKYNPGHPVPRHWTVTGKGGDMEGATDWPKPAGFRIVGIVFYGREATVSILDCYLRRNLAKNGGMLDEVIFVVRTTVEEDLAWLEKLLADEPAYTRHDVIFEGIDYSSAYDVCENGTMYIKMDDDIVFMEDHAIATIVKHKLEHPELFVVAANVVNQPSLSWMHYALGAIKPYFPELTPPTAEEKAKQGTWRASELPVWDGPSNYRISEEEKLEPPFEGHRWLPLPDGFAIEETPIKTTSFDAFSQGLWHWQVAAQEHYSFFENLEYNELWKYKFHTLDYHTARMGIQMIAIWGEDVILSNFHDGNGDDEYHFTEVMTKRTGRRAVVDGRGLVAHYSFLPQRSGIASTDILERYRAFADENVCPRKYRR